ncbi:hypothetical protein ACFLU5_06245 [Bacteroidota bacterium]
MVEEIKNKKKQLRVANMRHEKALANEYNEISENLTSGKAKILMIGGGIAISYWVIRMLISKKRGTSERVDKGKKKGKSLTRQTDNEILNVIKERIALFLVDLAQDVLTEAIKKLDK